MKNYFKYQFLIFLLISLQSPAQTKLPAGYPDRNPSFDVLPGFINPPKGYGEVPFFWWQGDTLTRERLLWQLDQLNNKGISSLQINYSHLDSGGLSYGLSRPSKPALYTDEWWKLFKWFASESQKRNISVSLSDYTLGLGQGFSMDEAIRHNSDLNGSILKSINKTITGSVNIKMPENLLTLTAIKIKEDSSLIITSRLDIISHVKNGNLIYDFGRERWKMVAVFNERIVPSYDPMNPKSGESYIKYFFERFEEALPGQGGMGLNFFFSDELNFRLSGNLWNRYFPDEFKKRKGYDIRTYLDALFVSIGPITPKIKLDYNDVIVSLSEENFFKPVFQWHQDRGMIFGCDHGGRGKDVVEFGDYFRTQRWNQGPGSDQPNLSKDIIKAKVASSIAHLYERPRVWLEGFHSSGWGTSSADVTDAVFADFVAGYNLLSFHGLYYSTHGGWWEWAPPDNHFRMPYWNQIDPLMNCIQRLSFLLSQGYHNCDVAIIYPAEPVIAEMDGKKSVSIAFETGEQLYKKGIDFDFIDFESLARSEVKNSELNVAGEKYKVLIVPYMKAIRFSSLKKIEAFKKAGGIIVNIGNLPEATEKKGANDPEISKLVTEIFSKSTNLIQCKEPKDVLSSISGKYRLNFQILTDINTSPYVMHRIIGNRSVYALYNFPEGTRCQFNAKGNAQLWNPWNSEILSLSEFSKQTREGTEITLPLSEKEIQVIVFDSENIETRQAFKDEKVVREVDLGNEWEFELKPSLDNRWGDFQFPAKNEMLGAQVRQMHYANDKDYNGQKLVLDSTWRSVTCGFGPQFLKLGPLPFLPSEVELLKIDHQNPGDVITVSGNKYMWEEYEFSWQQGVEGDYGHQGYHGLKGEIYDNFIRLGALGEVKMSKVRIPEKSGNYYILYTKIVAPSDGTFNLLTGKVKPSLLYVNNSKVDIYNATIALKKGANPIIIVYNTSCETYFVVRIPEIPQPERQPVSMSWFGDSGILPFDCSSGMKSSGLFAFESAPGLRSLNFSAYGKVTIWIDGSRIQPREGQRQTNGFVDYAIDVKNIKPESSQAVLEIEYQQGYFKAAAIPQYLKQVCVKGSINLGDWSKIDGLEAYSGGAWYRKTIDIDSDDLKNKLEIDLGDLVSSAELFINGKSAGIRLSPPWTYDITKFARQGENQIEVLIYNTLANNYTTIPTRYRGEIRSGLIGPVKLQIRH